MNYKVVSSKQVIAKVFRDLKPDNDSFVADALEWIGEALEFIGVYSGLEKTFEDLEVTNFRAHLPCDLHLLAAIEYNGNRLRYGSNPQIHALHRDPNAVSNPNASEIVTTAFQTDPTAGNEPRFRTLPANYDQENYYLLDLGKIETTIEQGEIRVHYMRLPVDKDFYPMVPDNVTVKEALQWYILRQMLMGGHKHPIFSWDFADSKWEAYCGKAQNDLMFPSPDKVERFRDMWVGLIPNVNAYNEFHNNY